jgi:hypothetical protein
MAIKCYTRQKKNGGNYTNCVDGKGKQMREKDRKKVVKRKRLVIVDKPKAQNDITVASGGKGTTTPFKTATPKAKPISMEEELGLMPQDELNAQMTTVRNLVAKAKALRKPKGEKFQYSSGNSRLGGVSAPRMSFMSNPNY